ncbi:MAG: ABC transporter ATP-binding protein [Clostridia bacterium]|nr:ABC transporter ATP-binding protein [Clostridia bacterium]
MIKITDLQKSYGENTVIDGLSFSVNKGEKIAIMAPSGCGKTTLLRLLMGLERQDGGRVEMADKAAFLFQEPRLFPQFTVLQNVMAVIDGKERKKRALEALMLVGLSGEEDKYPNEISGGMAQRAVLARALVTGRSIFLLDEPFKGLDEQAKEQIFALCRRALADKTVLLVTHDDKEARALCEKIVSFEKGMKVRDVVEL